MPAWLLEAAQGLTGKHAEPSKKLDLAALDGVFSLKRRPEHATSEKFIFEPRISWSGNKV